MESVYIQYSSLEFLTFESWSQDPIINVWNLGLKLQKSWEFHIWLLDGQTKTAMSCCRVNKCTIKQNKLFFSETEQDQFLNKHSLWGQCIKRLSELEWLCTHL